MHKIANVAAAATTIKEYNNNVLGTHGQQRQQTDFLSICEQDLLLALLQLFHTKQSVDQARTNTHPSIYLSTQPAIHLIRFFFLCKTTQM